MLELMWNQRTRSLRHVYNVLLKFSYTIYNENRKANSQISLSLNYNFIFANYETISFCTFFPSRMVKKLKIQFKSLGVRLTDSEFLVYEPASIVLPVTHSTISIYLEKTSWFKYILSTHSGRRTIWKFRRYYVLCYFTIRRAADKRKFKSRWIFQKKFLYKTGRS